MRDNDAEINDMYMETYVENFRGIHASHDIEKGTMILFVPYQLMITYDLATESGIGKLMMEKDIQEYGEFAFLCAFIME